MTKSNLVFLGGLLAGLATPHLIKAELTPEVIDSAEAAIEVEPIHAGPDRNEVMCMALNLYHEARGESKVGRLAVMNVVMNRAKSSEFKGSTICDVVMSGRKDANGRPIKHKCAFSWMCDGRSDTPKNMEMFDKMYNEAEEFLSNNEVIDVTEGAVYYHSTGVNPNWKFEKVTRIDNHIFYR